MWHALLCQIVPGAVDDDDDNDNDETTTTLMCYAVWYDGSSRGHKAIVYTYYKAAAERAATCYARAIRGRTLAETVNERRRREMRKSQTVGC